MNEIRVATAIALAIFTCSCKYANYHGEAEKNRSIQEFNDGKAAIEDYFSNKPKVDDFPNDLDGSAYYSASIRYLTPLQARVARGCAASIRISNAYKKDLFGSDEASRWKNDTICALSREYQRQIDSHYASLNKVNADLERQIMRIDRMRRDISGF